MPYQTEHQRRRATEANRAFIAALWERVGGNLWYDGAWWGRRSPADPWLRGHRGAHIRDELIEPVVCEFLNEKRFRWATLPERYFGHNGRYETLFLLRGHIRDIGATRPEDLPA